MPATPSPYPPREPGWFVYDPNPVDEPGPVLVGPFPSRQAADEYANLVHPDDGSGDAVVLPATAPAA